MNQANPYEALGLPPTWSPVAPYATRLGRVVMDDGSGPVGLHVVIIDTPAGRVGLPLDDAGARSLIDALSAQVSGITVARALPNNNGGNHP